MCRTQCVDTIGSGSQFDGMAKMTTGCLHHMCKTLLQEICTCGEGPEVDVKSNDWKSTLDCLSVRHWGARQEL
jgi:hypothetical protein